MKHLLVLTAILSVSGCRGEEDEKLRNLFFERGIEGGILISSLDGGTEYLCNRERIEGEYSPDATFYIAASLIALEEKAVVDASQMVSWDGEDRGLSEWNRDQNLKTAYRFSCLWAYQILADRVGLKRTAARLKAMEYGNGEVGRDVLNFWINGDLTVSAPRQIAFLKKLYREALPVQKAHQQLVKQWMVVRKTKNETLYAKTAWASHTATQHAWDIGFVESKGKGVFFFALNMKVEQASEAPLRQEIVDEALRLKGIIR